jgi:hypothetical protein
MKDRGCPGHNAIDDVVPASSNYLPMRSLAHGPGRREWVCGKPQRICGRRQPLAMQMGSPQARKRVVVAGSLTARAQLTELPRRSSDARGTVASLCSGSSMRLCCWYYPASIFRTQQNGSKMASGTGVKQGLFHPGSKVPCTASTSLQCVKRWNSVATRIV